MVDEHLPETSYLLLPGVHRMQSVEPKDDDSFTGEFGAVMNGAVRLGLYRAAKRALAGSGAEGVGGTNREMRERSE